MDDILKLKELLDADTFAPVAKQLQQKAWLLHWSLFVFFNHESGLNALIDLFMNDRCARPPGVAAAAGGGGWLLADELRRAVAQRGGGDRRLAGAAEGPRAPAGMRSTRPPPPCSPSPPDAPPSTSSHRSYLTAIQLTSQHLLRYLAVAVVVNKRRRNVLADLKRVVAQEAYEYRWGAAGVEGARGQGWGNLLGRAGASPVWLARLGAGSWPPAAAPPRRRSHFHSAL